MCKNYYILFFSQIVELRILNVSQGNLQTYMNGTHNKVWITEIDNLSVSDVRLFTTSLPLPTVLWMPITQ